MNRSMSEMKRLIAEDEIDLKPSAMKEIDTYLLCDYSIIICCGVSLLHHDVARLVTKIQKLKTH